MKSSVIYLRQVLVICSLLVLAGIARAGAVDDTGAWSITVRQAGEWVTAPDLPAETDIACHVHGAGRFRVVFQQGEAQRRYTVDLPALDWTTFKRHLDAGPVKVRVEPLPDEREPKPKFTGLIATINPDFQPAMADFNHPLYARVINLGGSETTVHLTGACGDVQRANFIAGYLTVEGLKVNGVLAAQGKSRLLNLSRLLYGRTVLTFQPSTEGETKVEVHLFADSTGVHELKTLRFDGKPAPVQTVVCYPQQDGSLKLVTTDELIRSRLEELKQALRDDPRPVPVRSRVTNAVGDSGESLDTYDKEVAISRG